MKAYRIRFGILTLALVVAAGCSQSSSTTSAARYKYEVRGASGTYSNGEAENFTVTGDQNAVSVQGGRLTVNGKGYGALNSGDSIVVDQSGKVTVNGAAR